MSSIVRDVELASCDSHCVDRVDVQDCVTLGTPFAHNLFVLVSARSWDSTFRVFLSLSLRRRLCLSLARQAAISVRPVHPPSLSVCLSHSRFTHHRASSSDESRARAAIFVGAVSPLAILSLSSVFSALAFAFFLSLALDRSPAMNRLSLSHAGTLSLAD